MTLNLETQIVRSRVEGDEMVFTAARQGQRWTFRISAREFAGDRGARRRLLATRAEQAMMGEADAA